MPKPKPTCPEKTQLAALRPFIAAGSATSVTIPYILSQVYAFVKQYINGFGSPLMFPCGYGGFDPDSLLGPPQSFTDDYNVLNQLIANFASRFERALFTINVSSFNGPYQEIGSLITNAQTEIQALFSALVTPDNDGLKKPTGGGPTYANSSLQEARQLVEHLNNLHAILLRIFALYDRECPLQNTPRDESCNLSPGELVGYSGGNLVNSDSDCPLPDSFAAISSAVDPDSQQSPFSQLFGSADELLLNVMKMPFGSSGNNGMVSGCFCHDYERKPMPMPIVLLYKAFSNSYTTINQSVSPALKAISANNFAALTGEYATLKGPIINAIKSFSTLNDPNPDSKNFSFAKFQHYYEGGFGDESAEGIVTITQAIPQLVETINELYISLNQVSNGYKNICDQVEAKKMVQVEDGKCHCPEKAIFDDWKSMLYSADGESQSPFIQFVSDLHNMKYLIPQGIEFDTSKTPDGCLRSCDPPNPEMCLCDLKTDYTKVNALVDKILSEQGSTLQKIINDLPSIGNVDFCYEDVKVKAASVGSAVSKLQDSLSNLKGLFSSKPYCVDSFNAVTSAPGEAIEVYTVLQQIVDLYFSHCNEEENLSGEKTPILTACPLTSDFSTLESLVNNGNSGLPDFLDFSNNLLQSFLKFPTLSGNQYQIECLFSPPFPLSLLGNFVTSLGKFSTVEKSITTFINNVLANPGALPGDYGRIIPLLNEAKAAFDPVTSTSPSGIGVGATSSIISSLLKGTQSGTSLIKIVNQYSAFLQAISNTYTILRDVYSIYINNCNPPEPPIPMSKVALPGEHNPRNCNCPMKELFTQFQTLLYPPAGSNALTLVDLGKSISELQYAIASSLQTSECAGGIVGHQTITADYSGIQGLVNTVLEQSNTVLKPFVDGMAEIDRDPVALCYEDVKSWLSLGDASLSAVNTDLQAISTIVSAKPYWVDANNTYNDTFTKFTNFMETIINAVELYFSRCKKKNETGLLGAQNVEDSSCPLSDSFNTLSQSVDESSTNGSPFTQMLSSADTVLEGVMGLTGGKSGSSTGSMQCYCYYQKQPGPMPAPISTAYTAFSSLKTTTINNIKQAVATISNNNFSGLPENYQTLVPLFTQLGNNLSQLGNYSLPSDVFSENSGDNVAKVLSGFPQVAVTLISIKNTINQIVTAYNTICKPTPTAKDTDFAPHKCDCPDKDVFDKWQNALASSGSTSFSGVMNAVATLKYMVPRSFIGSCTPIHECNFTGGTWCTYICKGGNPGLLQSISELSNSIDTVLQPFVDGLNEIGSNIITFCYEDVKTILGNLSGQITAAKNSLSGLTSTVNNNPYCLDCFKALDTSTSSFTVLYEAIVQAITLYYSHCTKSQQQ